MFNRQLVLPAIDHATDVARTLDVRAQHGQGARG